MFCWVLANFLLIRFATWIVSVPVGNFISRMTAGDMLRLNMKQKNVFKGNWYFYGSQLCHNFVYCPSRKESTLKGKELLPFRNDSKLEKDYPSEMIASWRRTNSADPDQLTSEEANWSGSTLFVKVGYIRVSLRGLVTLSGEITLSKLFCFPSKKMSTLKGKGLYPWSRPPFRRHFSEEDWCAVKQTGNQWVIAREKMYAM